MRIEQIPLVGPFARLRLVELARSLRARRQTWALFAGAGLSLAAGVPDWKQLVLAIAKKFDVACDANASPSVLPDVLDACLEAAETAKDFWAAVSQQVCIESAGTDTQRLLLRLPFEVFATTNLDCILDGLHVGTENVAEPRIVSYPILRTGELAGRRLIHLHGSCECSDEPGFLADVVLTASSYREAYGDTSMLPLALEALFTTHRVLLIGTSFNDPDLAYVAHSAFKRLIGHAGSHAQNPHYALVPHDTAEADEAIDWTYAGKRYGIDPIHYLRDRDHAALQDILTWLEEQVNPLGKAQSDGEVGVV
jgi:hypothetical protein